MKNLMSFILSTFMLLGAFGAVYAGTGSETAATAVTGGLGLFSAAMYSIPAIGGFMFSTVVIPDFTLKSRAELKDYTPEELEAYSADKAAYHAAILKRDRQIAIDEATENSATKDELAAIKSEFQNKLDLVDEAFLHIKGLTEGANKTGKVETLASEVKAHKEAISKLAKGVSAKEITLKADTNRASVANSTSAVFIEEVGQLGVKRRSLYDKLRKFPMGNGNDQGTVRYIDWDEATTVRAAAMVAEGAVFPESTAKFAQYSLDLKKIGDTLPVTEEFLEDEVTLSNELGMFLETNVDSLIDAQLITGSGVGNNLTGLVASVPAFVPVASAIVDPNIYDLVKKVSTDIKFNRGSKYNPDMVVANANVLDRLWLHKDANNNYVFRDLMAIGSMELIEDNNMADNTLIVGEGKYGRIYEKGGVVLSKGQPDAQFVEDMFTIKARKRMLLLIRTVDQTGFRKVTDIDAALVTLAL